MMKEETKADQQAKDSLRELVQHVFDHINDPKNISYEELAGRIGRKNKHGQPHAHGIGNVLAKMGHLVERISGKWSGWNEKIPDIQSLVVKKGTDLPLDGIEEFWPDYPTLNKKEKRNQVQAEYKRIKEFGSRWNHVLAALDIPPIEESDNQGVIPSKIGGGGESPEHKALKIYVRDNPDLIIKGVAPEPEPVVEYPFPSCDRVDVLFKYSDQWIAVEVKSRISDSIDCERGIYQCVKYRALLEAMKKDSEYDVPEKIQVVLLLENHLPKKLKPKAERLNIKVIEGIKVPKEKSGK